MSEARKTHVSIDGSGRTHDREWFAEYVRERFQSAQCDPQRSVQLTSEEAAAVVFLLDELAGVYSTEALGRIAKLVSKELAGRLYRPSEWYGSEG